MKVASKQELLDSIDFWVGELTDSIYIGWAKSNGRHHVVQQKRDVTDMVLGMAATHLMYGTDARTVSIEISTQDGPLGTLTFQRHVDRDEPEEERPQEYAN
jgi:hypothetical protein